MSTEHPITPPPELVQQWCHKWTAANGDFGLYLASLAARWGADQELDACCKLLDGYSVVAVDACANTAQNRLVARDRAARLRAARRPKPPSLAEQAFDAAKEMSDCMRAALERLKELEDTNG